MVWESNALVIVMCTKVVEGARHKCAQVGAKSMCCLLRRVVIIARTSTGPSSRFIMQYWPLLPGATVTMPLYSITNIQVWFSCETSSAALHYY